MGEMFDGARSMEAGANLNATYMHLDLWGAYGHGVDWTRLRSGMRTPYYIGFEV